MTRRVDILRDRCASAQDPHPAEAVYGSRMDDYGGASRDCDAGAIAPAIRVIAELAGLAAIDHIPRPHRG